MELPALDIFSILQIHPQSRSNQSIESLMRHTQNVQFFKNLASEDNFHEIHQECCKAMTLEEYSTDDFIFHFGEKGDKFYITLSGSVSVKIPSNKTFIVSQDSISKIEEMLLDQPDSPGLNIDFDKKPRNALYLTSNSSRFWKSRNSNAGICDFTLSEEERNLVSLLRLKKECEVRSIIRMARESGSDKYEIEICDFIEIGILLAGSAFGELALISDKPRSASIQARERCAFLVLNKNDFKKILGVLSENKLSSTIKFLQNIHYFHNWSKTSLTKISYYLEAIKLKKNQAIYRESEPVEGIYFIKDGEVIIEKKLITKSQTPSIFSSSPKNLIPKTLKKPNQVSEFKIVIKSKFESFGGFEVVEHKNLRFFSAICNSPTCEVLLIKKDSFLTRVPHIESIRNKINEDHKRILLMFDVLVDREESKKDLRNLNLPESERIEFLGLNSNWKSRFSSTCRRVLPSLTKSPKSRFLRKLTKQEVDEAVNGRSSFMRMYGSKCNIVNSSFVGTQRRQFLIDLIDSVKVRN